MPGADITSLVGTIGTWIGIALGVVALVGVVGPWLALQASMSERQQALNQLQDINQDYITKGYSICSSYRFFRRTKVPTLFNYHAVRIPEAHRRWTLHHIQPTTCRTRWARFCRVLEAYEVPIASGTTASSRREYLPSFMRPFRVVFGKAKTGIFIFNDKSGYLHFEAHHTWLPTSKFWILAIGLLGRYGKRSDRGRVVDAGKVRQDLDEERVLIDPNEPQIFDSDIDLPGYSYRTQNMIGHSAWEAVMASCDGNESETDTHPGIYGRTGEFEQLKPTNTIPCSVLFRWHNQAEMDLRAPREELLPLLSLYWLAAGFLPIGQLESPERVVQLTDRAFWEVKYLDPRGEENTSTISFGDLTVWRKSHFRILPVDQDDGAANFLSRTIMVPRIEDVRRPKSYKFFSLQPALDRPKSVRTAVEALGGLLIPIYTWQSVPVPDFIGLSDEERRYLQGRNQTFAARSRWVYLSGFVMNCENAAFFDRRDLQLLTLTFLQLPWDCWGYLIHQDRYSYWFLLLEQSAFLIKPSLDFLLAHSQSIGSDLANCPALQIILDHAKREDHNYSETLMQALVALESLLIGAHSTLAIVEQMLCVLVLTNGPFRDAVVELLQTNQSLGSSVANPLSDLVIDMTRGEARCLPDVIFEFDAGIFKHGTAQSQYHVSNNELAAAALRVGIRCRLWLTAINGEPLMEFLRRLDSLVYII